MPTRAALCPQSLEDQIQKRTAVEIAEPTQPSNAAGNATTSSRQSGVVDNSDAGSTEIIAAVVEPTTLEAHPASTAFARANWIPDTFEMIEVELCRDPILGLGITVAGYVHKKDMSTYQHMSTYLQKIITICQHIFKRSLRYVSISSKDHYDSCRQPG
ncbi:unnamed protein product [Gongylonema pulchrum]|uniref:Uncharacterized protein n=1 Tax=Gongylonema pulchrum TaxID=637853 RepID=A0A183CX50_9BILA|nr:unnamed protein product [Gongylonema pulchrum]